LSNAIYIPAQYIDDTFIQLPLGALDDATASNTLQKSAVLSLGIGSYELVCTSHITGDDFLAVRDFGLDFSGLGSVDIRQTIFHRSVGTGSEPQSISKIAVVPFTLTTSDTVSIALYGAKAISTGGGGSSDAGASLQVIKVG
jgi:hypothetical protein